MIEIIDLPLQDAKLFKLTRYNDNRGWFNETFKNEWLIEANINTCFCMDYSSFNINSNTVRGMHSQNHLAPQSKLVSCANGSILDVLIDARQTSKTYQQYCTIKLTKDDPSVVYIPPGFYHGFITLEPNTYVNYKVDEYQNKEAEVGLMWNDSFFQIPWTTENNITISQRDQSHPNWNDCYKF